jgi:hypothetical protein
MGNCCDYSPKPPKIFYEERCNQSNTINTQKTADEFQNPIILNCEVLNFDLNNSISLEKINIKGPIRFKLCNLDTIQNINSFETNKESFKYVQSSELSKNVINLNLNSNEDSTELKIFNFILIPKNYNFPINLKCNNTQKIKKIRTFPIKLELIANFMRNPNITNLSCCVKKNELTKVNPVDDTENNEKNNKVEMLINDLFS